MGGHPLHGMGTGGVPGPGGTTAGREAPEEKACSKMGLHLGSGGKI